MPVAALVAAMFLADFAGGPKPVLARGIAAIYLVWFVWAVVGTVRAAIAFRNGDAHWASKLVAVAVFVGLVPILIGFYNDLGVIRRGLLGF